RIKHAEAIEDEGVLDERAQTAWQLASEDWNDLGERSIPTTAAFTIKLGRLDDLQRQRDEKLLKFKQVTGDAYIKAQEAMLDRVPAIQKEAYMTPAEKRTKAQASMAAAALEQLSPDLDKVAKATAAENRLQAVQLVAELEDLTERITKTRGYRDQINFTYWQTLSIAEQEERTVRARRLIYEAEKANADAELDQAIGLYEKAFEVWADIFDDYPILVIDDSADDLFDSVRRYMIATDSEELPEDFPLNTFVSLMGEYGVVDQKMYEEVRTTQRAKLEERQRELSEQERRLEEEAAKAEAAEANVMKEDASATESEEADEDTPVKSDVDVPDASEAIDPPSSDDEAQASP
ncbi:MAG: IRE (iron responsive element), partial [Planctomycetota bacterium]